MLKLDVNTRKSKKQSQNIKYLPFVIQSQVFLNPKYIALAKKKFNKVGLIHFDSGTRIFKKKKKYLVSFRS